MKSDPRTQLFIEYYRRQKNVQRLQTTPTLRTYNLLEHTYMVVVLFRHFASLEDIAYDMQVLDKILHHDILEAITSDLPWTVKNLNITTKRAWQDIETCIVQTHPSLQRYTDASIKEHMTPIQHKLFTVCDLLELWIFLMEERTLGNRAHKVNKIIAKCEQLILGKFPRVDAFMQTYALKIKEQCQV